MRAKKVYLVGAGPGRPDLITVRGLNILKVADVIIYDYLVDKRVLEEARPDAELISCGELGKARYSEKSSLAQQKLNRLIVEKAKKGKCVIRLKNGDPSIFSRSREEIEVLMKNKIDFEIVPGVTAASAASAFSGVPLTDRKYSSSVVILTGHEWSCKKTDIEWRNIASFGTIVIYMAVSNISDIVDRLAKAGKSLRTPVVLVSEAGDVGQITIRANLKNIVKEVRKERIEPPAIFIIGKTAELERDFNWLRKSKKTLFTGLSKERFFLNGAYYHMPLIRIEPLRDYYELDGYFKKMPDYDWIVFASRYGVQYFFERLFKLGFDSRIFKGVKIAAVGNSTRTRLLDFGIVADLVPRIESSKGLVGEFKKLEFRGKKVFLPRSAISDKGLQEELERLGAEVTTCFTYRNIMPENLPNLDLSKFDEIMFTSPSTVRNFKKRYKKLPKNIKVRCIGDVTRQEAERCQLLD